MVLGVGCNRDIAQEGAIGFLRQLVPSDEWLTAGFWRQTAQKAKTAGKRVVGVLLDDGEGDLDDWLEHKVPGCCSRRDIHSSMAFHSICRHRAWVFCACRAAGLPAWRCAANNGIRVQHIVATVVAGDGLAAAGAGSKGTAGAEERR